MNTTVKVIIGIVVLVAIGVGVWLAAPLFYDKEVNEALPPGATAVTPRAVPDTTTTGTATVTETVPAAEGIPGTPPSQQVAVQGTFTGFDELHQASGTARIVEANGTKYLRFEEDFTVTNGPDLYVYLGRNGEYASETNLGRLKGNIGSQNYEIPDSIDLSQYDEAWVWCRAFAVPFGKAELR